MNNDEELYAEIWWTMRQQIACSKCQELKIKLVESKSARVQAQIRARLRKHTENKHKK